MKDQILVNVQHRHVHLSPVHTEALFGAAKCTKMAELAHRGQFACDETVTVVGPNGVSLERVRVLGPTRDETQVELSPTEAYALGLDAPVRLSGDLSRTGSCTLVGPSGSVEIQTGLIIPARHLHVSDRDAARLGLSHHGLVSVAPVGRPDAKIELVSVRVHPTFALELHLTYDEASEFWVQTGDRVTIV
ncbi:propanediol utilization protein [bacterium]|nr:propanediol utilization protein [bacterium]